MALSWWNGETECRKSVESQWKVLRFLDVESWICLSPRLCMVIMVIMDDHGALGTGPSLERPRQPKATQGTWNLETNVCCLCAPEGVRIGHIEHSSMSSMSIHIQKNQEWGVCTALIACDFVSLSPFQRTWVLPSCATCCAIGQALVMFQKRDSLLLDVGKSLKSSYLFPIFEFTPGNMETTQGLTGLPKCSRTSSTWSVISTTLEMCTLSENAIEGEASAVWDW